MTYLLKQAKSSEGKAFYLKMMADYQRYLAEISVGDTFKVKMEEAKAYYDAAMEQASEIFATHPLRLAIALNYSVFIRDILH